MRLTLYTLLDENHCLWYLDLFKLCYRPTRDCPKLMTLAILSSRIHIETKNTILGICTEGKLWKCNLVHDSVNFELVELQLQLRDICVMADGEILVLDVDDNLRVLSNLSNTIMTNVKYIVPNFEFGTKYSSLTCMIVSDRISCYNVGGVLSEISIDAIIIRESVIVDSNNIAHINNRLISVGEVTDIAVMNDTVVIIDTDDKLWIVTERTRTHIPLSAKRIINVMRMAILVEDLDGGVHIIDAIEDPFIDGITEAIRFKLGFKLLDLTCCLTGNAQTHVNQSEN